MAGPGVGGKEHHPRSCLLETQAGSRWPHHGSGRVVTLGLQSDVGGNPDWSLTLEQVLGSGWVGAVSGRSLNVMLFTDSNRPFLRTPRRLNVLELFASQPTGCTGNIGYQL